jgi:streptogramin lyase
MRRALLAVVLAALALPAAAQAVTYTEFDIEPGAPAGTHQPRQIAAGPGDTLWYADQGTASNIGRSTVFGERLAPYAGDDAYVPVDVLPSAGIASFGVGLRTVGPGASTPVAGALGGGGLVLDASGELVYAYGGSIAGAVCKVPDLCGSVMGVTSGPGQLILGPDGRVWGVLPGSNAVVSYASSAGTAPADGRVVELPDGSFPIALTAGADGNVWVAAYTGNRLDRITPAGQRTPFALPAGTRPNGIVSGPDGGLWVTGAGNGTVLRLNTAGQVTATFPTSSAGSIPAGITVGPDGAIWFTLSQTGKLGRITLDPLTPGAGGGGTQGGGGTTGGGRIRDTLRPRFLGTPAFTPASVRLGRSVRLVVALSEPARLRILLGKRATGRRVNGTCVKPTRRNRGRSTCTRYPTVRTLNRTGVAGANRIAVSTAGLSRGTWRATVTATDTAGNRSTAARATLTITRRR